MTITEEILSKARNYHTDNEELAEELEQKLDQADALAADISDLLEDTDFMNQPEEKQAEATRGSYNPLLGKMIQIPAGIKVYKCPECDYMWLQNRIGETPPECSEHKIQLQLIDNI
jgi:rubrerythrin